MDEMYIDRDPLHVTVETGSKEKILDFLEFDTEDLEVIDYNGNTVLHLVIKNQKLIENDIVEISKLFISEGIDPSIKNYNKETALHLAVARRMKDVVDLLVCDNDKPSMTNNKENLITHYFVEAEYKKFSQKLGPGPIDLHNNSDDWNIEEMEIESARFVEWLILKGFDFDSRNENKQSAVHLAILYNLQHILPVLLKHTKYIDDINQHGETLLSCFLSRDYKPGVYFEKFYQKRYAVTIIKILLDRGVPMDVVDNTGRTALQIAVKQEDDMSIINCLVNSFPKSCSKSNIITTRFYHIMCSCQSWNSRTDYYLRILKELLAEGANLNYQCKSTGTTPLYYAVKWKNLHALKFLQKNGANFKVKTKNGQNLLYQVIEKPITWNATVKSVQLEIFEILLNEGCEVNAVDEHGLSPLHLAARLNDMPILLRLIERGADVNCMTANLTTPLHYVLVNPVDAVNVCQLLVDHGANVNAKNLWGIRPIHLVANVEGVSNVERILNILVKQGADINSLDDGGESLLYRAILQNQTTDFINELLKWGANVNDDFVTDFIYEGNGRKSTKTLLTKHWLKLNLETIAPPYARKYKWFLFFIKYKCSGYQAQCFKELNSLKTFMINNRTSLYCLLHMHPRDRSVYVKNEKLLSAIGSPAVEERFPEYSDLILAAYRGAVLWKTLVELAQHAWIDLTGIRLPDICIRHIFGYLNNAELIKIIDYNTLPNGTVEAFKLLSNKYF